MNSDISPYKSYMTDYVKKVTLTETDMNVYMVVKKARLTLSV